MKSLLVLALAAVFTGHTHAVEMTGMIQSEYLHQTDGGMFEVTPGIGGSPAMQTTGALSGYRMIERDYQSSTEKAKGNGFPLNVGVEYGFNSMLSVGANFEYFNEKTKLSSCPDPTMCNSPTKQGFADPTIFVHARTEALHGVFQYGLNANLMVEKHKVKVNGDTNVATGGDSLQPFVAYQTALSTGVFGMRLGYTVPVMDRKASIDNASGSVGSKEDGGNTMSVSAFYEYPVETYSVGASLAFDSKTASKTTLDGMPTMLNDNAKNTYAVDIYVPLKFNTATFVPNFEYMREESLGRMGNYNKVESYALGASLRLPF